MFTSTSTDPVKSPTTSLMPGMSVGLLNTGTFKMKRSFSLQF
nr:hypothetical protein [Denitrobacterium detoxificans]